MTKFVKIISFIIFAIIFSFGSETFSQTEVTEQLAIQYYNEGEFAKATTLFEVLYNKTPTPFYYSYYIDCLIKSENYEKAIKFLEKQSKKNPEDPKCKVDLGYIFIKSGNENAGRKHFDKIIKEFEPDEYNIKPLADAFTLRFLYDYALQVYVKAKKKISTYPFNLEVADIYVRKGDLDLALNEYLDLLDYDHMAYMAPVQNILQDILASDPENKRNDAFKQNLLSRIKKDPDKIYYSELLLWFFIQQKDFDAAFIQAKSVNKRMNEYGQRIYTLASLAAENSAYDAAIECYSYLISLGESNPYWFQSRMLIINTKFLKITQGINYNKENLLDLENEYYAALAELGKNYQTIMLMKNLAHIQAFYLDKTDVAISILNEALSIYGSKPGEHAECKIELADILLMTGDVWEATLLYSQVEKAFKNDPLGFEAKLRNARLSFYIGEFEWAKAQLDVLKASTSKLIANDAMQLSLIISDNIDVDSSLLPLQLYAKADLMVFRRQYDLAIITLDSIKMLALWHPIFDEVLFKKAEIMLANRKFSEADSLLQQLYDFYPDDILADDAVFKLAELQETVYDNKEKAMEYYKIILQNYPGSLYVVEARKRFRSLRGDILIN